ncbi:cytochrome oxidase maturation protein, cbb3-type [Collimonas sp. OK607]|jgi:cbb3-type cytochrome oxidase maturation protein|uniref:cbb3-type cytochrome oxidase assembly protein CcoS n=1 Tax=Collimonas sp. OK607 TaxID=1798194 RepID=UPI0008EF2ED3|nr:cbb3-type cytochrome oxidase assembly protein CcoS [Collimonas sp. OK607]SFB15833.1 cytochrome oxidase maturation protein, cbb3-type [Collimonas sp. OK607]
MEALYLLIPISTVLVFLAIWVFVRASDSGQFDDMVGPAMRILLDDDSARPPEKIVVESRLDNEPSN